MNTGLKQLIVTLAIAMAVVTLPAAHAVSGIPDSGSLGFTVLRDGKEVGSHTLTFRTDDDAVKVDVRTSVNVKVPFIGLSVYHFEHEGHEVRRGGTLHALESTTDDDGEDRELQVTCTGDTLQVDSNVASHVSAGSLIPASLWHPGHARMARRHVNRFCR